MLDPRYLQQIADGAEYIAAELHVYIVRQIVERMMERIGRGEKYLLTSSDRWRIEVLQDSGYLLEDITAELAKYTKRQEKEIKAAMEEAGVKALEYDDKIYQAAGLSPMPLTQSPALIRLMERNYNVTLNSWKNMTRTTANEAQKTFINQCDRAYNLVSSGAISYSQAVRECVNEVCENGVKIKYPSGREMTIEAATAMVVRTGISQACGQITLARMKEMEVRLCLVSGHIGARTGSGGPDHTNHLYWQSAVYSVDWNKVDNAKKEGG